MKKLILYILLGILPYFGMAQRYSAIDLSDTSYVVFEANTNQVVYKSKFPKWFIFYADSIRLKALDMSKLAVASTNYLWATDSGFLKVSVLDSMFGRTKVYNHSGIASVKPYKIYSDTITATTGNGFSVDISSAGFTRILAVQVQPEFSTTDANTVPATAIKSWTNSAITVNVVNQSRIFVSLLGLTISTGLQFVNNIKLHVTVIGY